MNSTLIAFGKNYFRNHLEPENDHYQLQEPKPIIIKNYNKTPSPNVYMNRRTCNTPKG